MKWFKNLFAKKPVERVFSEEPKSEESLPTPNYIDDPVLEDLLNHVIESGIDWCGELRYGPDGNLNCYTRDGQVFPIESIKQQ